MNVAKVGERAPDFAMQCVPAADVADGLLKSNQYAGRWLILIFYPRDFSFVCPTELTAFSARWADFDRRGCDLLGISVDSVELHKEWVTTSPDEGGLGPIQFPLASDSDGQVARNYGVWIDDKEVSTRGLFIIDPDGILQYSVVHNLSIGRSPDEVLRVLDALKSGGLCPASWTSADGTIDPENALRAGRILGHYRIRGKLGGGTFGTVFAAWDLRLERTVAIKILNRRVFESREVILSEARAAAKINHPHVCTIYSVEEIDGLPVIVMEYLDGSALSQVMTDGLTPARAYQLSRQMAAGIAAAHEQNVVHGDLKPANVIVNKNDVVKILDFGLATSQTPQFAAAPGKTVQGEHEVLSPKPNEHDADATIAWSPSDVGHPQEAVNNKGTIQGTPAYMSPEHALGQSLIPASDVFSLGLLLFEMVTGRRLITSESPLQWIRKLRTGDLSLDLESQVGEDCRDLLTAMLAQDPTLRPAMNEVRQRLPK